MTSLEKLVGQVYGNIGASEPNNNNNNNRGGNGKRDTNSNNNNRDKRPRIVDALEIVRSKCLSLFVDQIGEPYAAIKVKDHIETIAIGRNRFKELVIKACYDYKKEQQNQLQKLQQEQLARTQGNDSFHSEQEGAAKPANEYGISETTSDSSSPVLLLGNEDAAKIQTIIKLEAEQSGNQEKLEIRVAGNVDPNTEENNQNYNVIYYDLNNKDGQIIKVTSNYWHIEKHGCSNNCNNSGNSSRSSAVVTTSLNILFKHYRNQLPFMN